MRSMRAILAPVAVVGLLLAGISSATAATYTNFSIAGATVIYATGVNATGQCTGWYRDASGVDHSFVFQPNGTVTTFDVPGSNGTAAMSINGLRQDCRRLL
jgi:probable HAF family extracellular repeat protein